MPRSDSPTGRHGHPNPFCQADIACLIAVKQQRPRGNKKSSATRQQSAQVGARAATFSQAVVLPALAALPGRARNCSLKGISDPRYESRDIGRQWPDNKAHVDRINELQVGAGNRHGSSACISRCHTPAYVHTYACMHRLLTEHTGTYAKATVLRMCPAGASWILRRWSSTASRPRRAS